MAQVAAAAAAAATIGCERRKTNLRYYVLSTAPPRYTQKKIIFVVLGDRATTMASTSQDKMVVSNPRTGCEYERGRLLGKGGSGRQNQSEEEHAVSRCHSGLRQRFEERLSRGPA